MQTCIAADACAKAAHCHAQEEREGRGGPNAAAKAVPEEAHPRLEAPVLVPLNVSLMAQDTLLAALAPQLQHEAETG